MKNYARYCLNLNGYLKNPGDRRHHPEIPAQDLLWTILIGNILRVGSFARMEWLARSAARAALGVGTPFSDDTLAYFTERLDAETTRAALASTLQQAKRNKAFENTRFIGLAVDGTGAGRTDKPPSPGTAFCRLRGSRCQVRHRALLACRR